MITITRRTIQQFRAVLRRTLGHFRTGPAIGFYADAEGLTVKSVGTDAAVELRVPGRQQAAETLWLPCAALDDFEGKKDDLVELSAGENNRISAAWRDGSVPRLVAYDSPRPPDADKLPALPEMLRENPPSLLKAFGEASDTADPGSARYALGCIRLRGEDGSLAATDGRQLLLQHGFHFPWTDDVLVPRSKVFTLANLTGNEPVKVGKSNDWVTFGVGPWFIHLRIDQHGRFPNLERIVPAADQAVGICRFSATDARFLADTLPCLPVTSDQDFRVTLDLNGQVIVRAKTAEQAKPTEIVLTGTSWSGNPLRLNVNCRQMARAVKLGLTDLYVFGDETPVAWYGETCKYISALLPRDCCVEPADDAIRIESPRTEATASASLSPPQKPTTERKPQPVNATNANSNVQAGGHAAKPNSPICRPKAGSRDIGALVEQAMKLRTALHDRTHEAGELVKALKQHRRQSRVMQQTLDQIRSLKSLGV